MEVYTYRKLSETILNTYYRGFPDDQASFTLRHVAELCAQEIAAAATANAINNSQLGEVTYADDLFISTYTGLTVQYDTALKVKYIPLPAIPAGMPAGRDIQSIWPVGSRKVQITPIKGKDRFAQNFLDPIPGVVLYYIQNNNVVFDNMTAFNFTAVNMNLIGAVGSGDKLLDVEINLPASLQGAVSEKVIARLLQTVQNQRNVVENLTDQPTA